MNSNLAKIAGWGQFAVNTIGTLATSGLPANPLGWLQLLSSLVAAVGIHSASNTDGSK